MLNMKLLALFDFGMQGAPFSNVIELLFEEYDVELLIIKH